MPKTASTTFQNYCQENLDTLDKQGYRYAQLPLRGKQLKNHSLATNYLFRSNPKAHHVHIKRGLNLEQQKETFHKHLEEELNQSKKLIISAEAVSLYSPKDLRKINTYFRNKGVNLHVILLVRNTLSYLDSYAQQCYKSGHYFDLKHEQRPAQITNKITSIFENTKILSFKEACGHEGGPTCELLKAIGLDVSGFVMKQEIHNTSLSNQGARLLNSVNKSLPLIKDGKKSNIRLPNDLKWIRDLPGEKFKLSNHEFDRSQIEKDNKWLVENYGPSFKEDISHREECTWSHDQLLYVIRHSRKCDQRITPYIKAYFLYEALLTDSQREFIDESFTNIYFDKKNTPRVKRKDLT